MHLPHPGPGYLAEHSYSRWECLLSTSGLFYTLPGKVFLLGEYLVLDGGPGLLFTVEPRFEVCPAKGETFAAPPQSPVGRLREYLVGQGHKVPAMDFIDPYEGRGGFGASTAQFILTYAATLGERPWREVWDLYRELCGGNGLVPSGADLVAQILGEGVVRFEPEGETTVLEPVESWDNLLVFSSTEIMGRKTATHKHLKELSLRGGVKGLGEEFLGQLKEVVQRGEDALKRVNSVDLGACLNEYADLLRDQNLESPEACGDRLAMAQIPGVLGCKGAGALLSDVVLVLVDPKKPKARDAVKSMALERGLKLVSEGMSTFSGLAL